LNKKLLFCLIAFCILTLAVTSASATTFTTEKFALQGTGSWMASPPIFYGDIIGGTLYPGTFLFAFDDTGWPTDNPGTPENERWNYIFAHYFVYQSTPGSEGWNGYFPPTGSGEASVKWRFYTLAGDTLGGSCTQLLITIRDFNANGILEASEYVTKTISSNIVAYINYSGGCFTNFCGQGSYSGNLTAVDPAHWIDELYVPSAASASGRLYLKDGGCTVGVAPSTWGEIKSFYK
jgi:hypothetical protein